MSIIHVVFFKLLPQLWKIAHEKLEKKLDNLSEGMTFYLDLAVWGFFAVAYSIFA